MPEKILHIITHDVPWPADFGGVIDLFYKIKTLHQNGVKIHLHAFVHKRPPQQMLEQYCQTVTYYPRKKLDGFSFRLPFIVSSRINHQLITNLQKDTHPVLIEGVHSSYYVFSNQLLNRNIVLRLYNVESEYYHQLALHEKSLLKKMYFKFESRLLKKYENTIADKVRIMAMSDLDMELYKNIFHAKDISHLPVFLPYTHAAGLPGKGCYCLYHGNLSINENEEAAIWLLQQVFSKLTVPFVIAGKNPSQKLIFLAHQHEHTCLVANPGDKELHDMIAKAQINILPSFNNTGVKLKLLNALFNGRHCLVNKAGVEGSGLENICGIAEDGDEFIEAISYLFEMPYEEYENTKRQELLQHLYNNQKNAEKIMAYFWS